ncbi:MAG: hypothetical protein RL094_425 [Candidatus Parcubacteria bacterium]|jgi:putative sigma-54 modulation protein
MNIIIKGNHLEVTEAIQAYVAKRFEGVNKFLAENAQVEVELSRTTNHHKSGDIFRAEVNIDNNGDQTYASANLSDMYAAIDEVREETLRVLSSKKGKKQSLWKRGTLRLKKMLRSSAPETDSTDQE